MVVLCKTDKYVVRMKKGFRISVYVSGQIDPIHIDSISGKSFHHEIMNAERRERETIIERYLK